MCYTVERELPKQARVDVSAAVCSRKGGDDPHDVVGGFNADVPHC